MRAITWYAQRALLGRAKGVRPRESFHLVGWNYSWLGKVGIVLSLVVAAVVLTWFQFRPQDVEPPSPLSVGSPAVSDIEPRSSTPPRVTLPTPAQKQILRLIARASWSREPEAERQAIRLETERGEVTKVEVPYRGQKLLIAFRRTDTESRAYTYYRVTLLDADKQIWQETLRAPRTGGPPKAPVMKVLLSSQPQTKREPLVLQFDGKTGRRWQPLGKVTLQRDNP